MAEYTAERTDGISQSDVKTIATAVAQGLQQSGRMGKAAVNPTEQRRKEYISGIQKEAALARALTTEAGLRKIAANMANPVRFYLDYKGIFRKFAVVEQMCVCHG